MSARVYFMKRVRDREDVSIMSLQDELSLYKRKISLHELTVELY